MNDPSKDWELRDASMTLGDLVRLSWTAGKLKRMEAEQLKNVEAIQLAITEGRDWGNELIERTEELSNEIGNARAFREIIENNTSQITQVVEKSLHVFADPSQVVVYGLKRPSKIIATSGHHAGTILLNGYLNTDYTSEFGFDFEELATQIQSERLRLFQVSDSFVEPEGLYIGSHQIVAGEIESVRAKKRDSLYDELTRKKVAQIFEYSDGRISQLTGEDELNLKADERFFTDGKFTVCGLLKIAHHIVTKNNSQSNSIERAKAVISDLENLGINVNE